MRTRIDAARLRIRPIWLMAAATCFIPTLLISDASQTTADARMMMERPMAGHAPRMGGGGHRMHGGGHRSHGHRGGHRSYGFSGGSAVGMGLAIGGMVIDQMQRAQARDRDYDDEPRDAPTRRHVDKPRNSTAVSKPKKQAPSSVARRKNDDTLYSRKKDEPRSGRDDPRDVPVSRRGDPRDVPIFRGGDPRDIPVARRGDPRDVPFPRRSDPRDVPVAYGDPRDVPVANDDPRDEPVPRRTTTREPGLKPPPEYPTSRPPVPALVPPSTPFLVSDPVPVFPGRPPAAHCRDCRELLIWIRRYEKQIANDEKKKEDSKKMLEERRREVEGLEGKLRKTRNPIWKDYYQQRIKTINEYIEAIDQMNTDLDKLIEKQKARLQHLKKLYEDCADPQCREQVTEVPQTPKEPEPAPEEPKDTPVNSAPPPEEMPNPTPVVLTQPEPQPGPSSTPASGPCVDHWAELTNSKRVFHRLYVLGTAQDDWERKNWPIIRDNIKAGLEGPGRQAPQSTSKDMDEPTWAEFRSEMQRLADTVQPCEEVTLYIGAHGGGGNTHGVALAPGRSVGEAKAEYVVLRKRELLPNEGTNANEAKKQLPKDAKKEPKQYKELEFIVDRDLGDLVKRFKPNVSFTLIISSCWGGGFAGKGNVEESKLVKVIGLYMQCPVDGRFDKEIRRGVDDLAGKSKGGRVTAIEIKDHLLQKGWHLGEPFDSPLDNYVNERLGEYWPPR